MPYPVEHRHLTKERILRSARRLFNRHGFDAVSIDDVMADAGLTRGSFYAYFASKGDLYAESVTDILNEKQILSSDGLSIDSARCRQRGSVHPRLSFSQSFRGCRRNLSPDRASDGVLAQGGPRSGSI